MLQVLVGQSDQLKPLSRHIGHLHDLRDRNRHIVAEGLMPAQEVEEGGKKNQKLIGPIERIKAILVSVYASESSVQSFNHLFQPTVFFRHIIVIG